MPYLLSLETVLAVIQLLDYFSPSYYIQKNRFWEETTFRTGAPLLGPIVIFTLLMIFWILAKNPKWVILPSLGFISFISLDTATSVALVSLLCVLVCIYLNRDIRSFSIGLLSIMCFIEAEALLQWLVLTPLGIGNPLADLTELEINLYYLVAQFSPVFMLLFALAGIGVPLHHLVKKPQEIKTDKTEIARIQNKEFLLLSLIVILSITVALYPYIPNVNPLNENPGADISSYLLEYKQVEGDVSKIFEVSGGSRPIYYLLLFGFQKLASLDALSATRYHSIILNPLLVLSIFFLAREVIRDNGAAVFSAFFTAAGFTLSVGMYAYFLADMLMLSIIFLSLAFLLRSVRTRSRVDLVAATTLGCLFVFTHPWTFNQYMAAVAVTTILVTYTYIRSRSEATNSKILIIYCIAIAASNIIKMTVLEGSVEGISALGTLAAGLTTTQTFWLDLSNSSRFYVGGFLTNMPLLALAALGIVRTKEKTVPNILLWTLLAMTLSVYLIGDLVIKSRVIFNIPIGIFASYGILSLDNLIIDSKLRKATITTIAITLIAYLFRDLSNLILR